MSSPTSTRRLTVEEYHQMAESGTFRPGERVELIRGVIETMTPQSRRHALSIVKANRLLTPMLLDRASVCVQVPLPLPGWHSEPEPGLFVLPTPDSDASYGTDVPLLLLEVADSSLDYDRTTKAELYAEIRILDYWILNLVDNLLEVYRDPGSNGYRTRADYDASESVSPLAWSDLTFSVDRLLPPVQDASPGSP